MDNCDAILFTNAAQDKTSINLKDDLTEYIYDLLSTADSEEKQKDSSGGGGLSGGFGSFRIKADFSQDNLTKWKKQVKQNGRSAFTKDLALEFLRESVNPDVVKAWLECKKQELSKKGLSYQVEENSDTINLKLEWAPSHEQDAPPKIIDFIVEGAEVKNPPSIGKKIPSFDYVIVLKREHLDKEVTIVLNTDKGTIQHCVPSQRPSLPWKKVENTENTLDQPQKNPSALEQTREALNKLIAQREDI